MKQIKFKLWCFVNKKTGTPEPLEGMDNKNKATRWQDGYGIFMDKKDLLKNNYDAIPSGYVARKITFLLKQL